MSAPPPFRFMLVTDRRLAEARGRPLAEIVEAAVRGGADAVQLREKDLEGAALLRLAREAREAIAGRALLLISDRADVARAAGADGVHLPSNGVAAGEVRRFWPGARVVGRSVHGAEDLRRAEAEGADYALLAPIFAPRSKAASGPPLGEEGFARIARGARIPVYALGGVTADNAARALAAGAAGVALIGEVMGAEAPERAARRVRAALDRRLEGPLDEGSGSC